MNTPLKPCSWIQNQASATHAWKIPFHATKDGTVGILTQDEIFTASASPSSVTGQQK